MGLDPLSSKVCSASSQPNALPNISVLRPVRPACCCRSSAKMSASNDAPSPLFKTALTESLGLVHPVILAPMCGFAMGDLAGAVAAAGGLGLLGAGAGSIFNTDRVAQEWGHAVRRSGGEGEGRLGVGFLENFMADDDPVFAQALRLKPKAIMLAFGAMDRLAAVKEAGVKAVVQVFSVPELQAAARKGADVLVLQGCDAGGHGRQSLGVSLMTLVPTARRWLNSNGFAGIPLVAAGGIMDGKGLAAALALGADGVALGTRFVTTHQSGAPEAFKQRVLAVEDGTTETVSTSTWDHLTPMGTPFNAGGYCGRALADSEALRRFGRRSAEDGAGITPEDAAWYKAAGYDTRAVWCGAGSGLVGPKDTDDAVEVVAEVVREAAECLRAPRHYEMVEREGEGRDDRRSMARSG